ncbi:hypothetical protein SMICM304S_02000 [Streptomyces microflavus]
MIGGLQRCAAPALGARIVRQRTGREPQNLQAPRPVPAVGRGERRIVDTQVRRPPAAGTLDRQDDAFDTQPDGRTLVQDTDLHAVTWRQRLVLVRQLLVRRLEILEFYRQSPRGRQGRACGRRRQHGAAGPRPGHTAGRLFRLGTCGVPPDRGRPLFHCRGGLLVRLRGERRDLVRARGLQTRLAQRIGVGRERHGCQKSRQKQKAENGCDSARRSPGSRSVPTAVGSRYVRHRSCGACRGLPNSTAGVGACDQGSRRRWSAHPAWVRR